ncbi:hypothetical protein ACT3TZ_07095 [Brachybacterium sp. AOP25-B2-12]|uniref:hypothetical protein n=1 Tax=Brachybacterium sp. AOP25-B2-12 TaxID=3457710 RepID=UPI0040340C0E
MRVRAPRRAHVLLALAATAAFGLLGAAPAFADVSPQVPEHVAVTPVAAQPAGGAAYICDVAPRLPYLCT